jgi:universal stress protein A
MFTNSTDFTVVNHAPPTQRILVAVDDSAPSLWAVQVAGELAQKLGARIVLLHVVTPCTAVLDIPITAEVLNEGARRQGAALLHRLGRLLPVSIDYDSLQLDGVAADEIVTAAEDSEVQMIVMGTRGAGRLSHFLLGSTAEAVIRQASCPVLTVSHEPRGRQSSTAAETAVCQVG